MPTTTSVSLVIVDAHAKVRRRLKSIFKTCDDVVVVGEARNCDEAARLCQQCQPDVVLMEMVLPDASGRTLIALLQYLSPETRPLVLSVSRSEDVANAAFKAGALGYLIKANVSHDDIVQAIHATMRSYPRWSSSRRSRQTPASV